MADTSGMQDLRGIDIDKLAKGFADEEFIFKNFCTVSNTSAREIRWYQKTAGILTAPTTTNITSNMIANVAPLAKPVTVEQSWTRNTSYVRKYFVESPWISTEDISDTDIDILATNVRDLTRAVASQVDTRIFNVLTESVTPVNITYDNTAGTGWDDASNGNPIADMLSGVQAIRSNGYDVSNLVILMDSLAYKNLMNYIITVKGSSIPAFASDKVESGVLMRILGHKVVVSQNVTTNYAVQFVPQRSVTWKSFVPITARTVEEVGIGVKIRVWEEGEGLLTDPKSVHLISGVN